MFSSDSHQDARKWRLPVSSWALPAITGLLVLLAVAAALA
jgi:hypothetical protein